ncbi:MAG TPA: protein-disulfide reductase DsbD domain-containing protein [Candidatus Angelobacter sp.]|nr:protein-disulfide reductase DsbD domain-containing protein [Candidatus Angelobacter sp.]
MSQHLTKAAWGRWAGAAAALVLLASGAAHAADLGATEWVRADESAVRLISATAAVGTAADLRIGLEFTLQPHWKTYWRSPGDAGFPVTVDWAGSRNLAAAEMAWPVPHRFSVYGLETFGYENQVVFPIAVRPQTPGQPVVLSAKVNYLACSEICIPRDAQLQLELPAGPAAPTDQAQLINRFIAQVPGDGARQGLSLDRVALAGTAEHPLLDVVASSAIAPFEKPDVIVEAPTGLYFSAPAVNISDGGMRATFQVPITLDTGAPPLKDAALTLTLADGVRGLEQKVVAGVGIGDATQPLPAMSSPVAPGSPFLAMLLIAVLGGLILNVMPCVLPVLSLKLLGLIGHDGENQRHVRLGFLASAAGILVAFAGLAAVLVALKAMGSAVGWGIQFQQPWFLIAMMLLLTLFAANLWGWFEIPVPAFIGRLAGIGSHATLAGQFGTGVFATLLATPCSAPFVGTAVAFALARGPLEIFAIFLALGVGFAAPYLLVAVLPAIAQLLPRPGRWMIVLRRILGLLLAGTAVWLLTILAGNVGHTAVWAIVGLVLAMTVALWARRRLPIPLRRASPIAVIVLALAAFVVPTQIATSRSTPGADLPAGFWKPFDQAAIARLVGEGKTVFVDVTADWCVTCIVNKRLILESTAVNARLTAPNVLAMQADWTRSDDGIARFLAANNRYGIPFNAVYGPGAPAGIVLPELLTERAVLDALAKAAGG